MEKLNRKLDNCYEQMVHRKQNVVPLKIRRDATLY